MLESPRTVTMNHDDILELLNKHGLTSHQSMTYWSDWDELLRCGNGWQGDEALRWRCGDAFLNRPRLN
jgi:hypothetical protein